MWQTLNFRRYVQKATKKIYTEKPLWLAPSSPRVPDLVCKITKRKTQNAKRKKLNMESFQFFGKDLELPEICRLPGGPKKKKVRGVFFYTLRAKKTKGPHLKRQSLP